MAVLLGTHNYCTKSRTKPHAGRLESGLQLSPIASLSLQGFQHHCMRMTRIARCEWFENSIGCRRSACRAPICPFKSPGGFCRPRHPTQAMPKRDGLILHITGYGSSPRAAQATGLMRRSTFERILGQGPTPGQEEAASQARSQPRRPKSAGRLFVCLLPSCLIAPVPGTGPRTWTANRLIHSRLGRSGERRSRAPRSEGGLHPHHS
jgi:hypothetical protein